MIKDVRSNLKSFQRAVDRFSRTVPAAKVNLMQRKLALQALRGLVHKTPIDTGRARGNWQTTTATPAEGAIGGITRKGQSVSSSPIEKGSVAIRAAQPFGVIWISNNLPYIEALEDGSSTQAPNGMLATTLSELRTQFS